MKAKIHNLDQGTNEWHGLRKGKMTASKASAIATNGKGLDSYIQEIVKEVKTGFRKQYSNPHIERGIELEDSARLAYEFEQGYEVTEVGFIELNSYVGCSPDGLVALDGGIEIKCPSTKVYLKYKSDGVVNKSYWWQMQMNMAITEREWWDYVVFNPDIDSTPIIKRIYRDEAAIKQLGIGLRSGVEKLKRLLGE